ncbi:MAG TPA: 4Fe-4S dicluster domain-containing protein [Thermoanaerobaculia bacterium]|nr:4Fe-4S dicluster domain-containing protein [Thermoanaerobaculia bacterium]HQR66382.1 4Fe-4S dicluster domain-containing protein [Thermoanaerobaculia bacterium]
MTLSRRALLNLGLTTSTVAATAALAAPAEEGEKGKAAPAPNYAAVLVDTTLCIGCRKCEEACNRRNHLPRTAESFENRDGLRTFRRPTANAFTVVNRFPGSPSPDQAGRAETYCKTQCMHCLIPSCVSACIVGALTKSKDGAVVYNPTICVGCRYCQIACPFEVPAYEFDVALTPKVRKCEFCTDRAKGTGANPACAASCPTEALVFGPRAELVAMAKDRIAKRPDRYVPHVYGENEVGGTSWIYLTGRPPEEIALLKLTSTAPALRTEAIQHGIFKFGAIPIALYGALAGLMWMNNRKAAAGGEPPASGGPKPPASGHEGGAA